MGTTATTLVFAIFLVASLAYGEDPEKQESLSRNSFPPGFVFGTASSAYQYEGAANEDGRSPSIWDRFTSLPGKIRDGSNGDVAVDEYHRHKEDVAIMDDLGFDAYRFSISWPRLLPGGHLSDGVNQEGIDYYNDLIDELLLKGIKPFVTIFHWDIPDALQHEYGGFLSSKVVDDFRDYSELCFRSFGDRVKHWITLNEPLSVANNGYATGEDAPGRCSWWYFSNCTGGDSATEPYIVAHHQLLAHAAAVKVYRDKYQVSQQGQIGITLDCKWILPLTPSYADRQAASRLVIFQYDWFMEPLKSGFYPIEMVAYVGKRLPRFTREQSMLIKGSFDFIGVNYYTSYYGTAVPCKTGNFSYSTDSCAEISYVRNGIPIGPKTAADWLYVYPEGILDVMLYTKYKFNNPTIYITENGYAGMNTGSVALGDDRRLYYYKNHLLYLRKAIEMGVKIKGFFAWSLLDNFEWHDGYTIRFGIVFVDYKDGLKRYMKTSALWFKELLQTNSSTHSLQQQHSSL